MIHPIRLFGDPVLRRRAQPVTKFDEGLAALAADMLATMYAAEGVGLAAPQIGVPLRMFVALQVPEREGDDSPPDGRLEHVMVNPVITRRAGVQLGRDGCLSIPGLFVEDVPRDLTVEVAYQDLSGGKHELTAEGYFAHVLQHEHDHLEGILFYDRLPPQRRGTFLEENRRELADMQRRAKAFLREQRSGGEERGPRAARVEGAQGRR